MLYSSVPIGFPKWKTWKLVLKLWLMSQYVCIIQSDGHYLLLKWFLDYPKTIEVDNTHNSTINIKLSGNYSNVAVETISICLAIQEYSEALAATWGMTWNQSRAKRHNHTFIIITSFSISRIFWRTGLGVDEYHSVLDSNFYFA